MQQKEKNTIIIWLYLGLVMVVMMVVIGGITRLTGSGLSMVEWNLISGTIPPMNEVQWQDTFEKYQQFPEYQRINRTMNLEEFKQIFFWEYIHRLLGRIIGLVFILPMLWFLFKKWIDRQLLNQLIILLLLGALQGFLGWFMVKSGLVDAPAVSHYRLAIHLITALLLIVYIFWLILRLEGKEKVKSVLLHRWSKWFVLLLMIQIVYGAFTAGLKARYLLPTNQNIWYQLFAYFTPNHLRNLNFLDNAYNIQFVHRLMAWLVLFFAILLYSKSRNILALKSKSLLLLLLIAIQIILGIITLVVPTIPVLFAATHQFVAVLVLLAAVRLVYFSSGNFQSDI